MKVPTLVLYGANDAAVPVARSVERLRTVASPIPGMRVHVIAGADHARQMSAELKTSLDPRHDGTEQPDSPEYVAPLASWLGAHGFARD